MGEEDQCTPSMLSGEPWLQTKWVSKYQDPNGKEESPHLLTFLLLSLRLGPDKESAPVPLPQPGLFLPRTEDETMGGFLVSTCPLWSTLGTQHPAQRGENVRPRAAWRTWLRGRWLGVGVKEASAWGKGKEKGKVSELYTKQPGSMF